MECPLTESHFAKESKPPFFAFSVMWFLQTSTTSSHSPRLFTNVSLITLESFSIPLGSHLAIHLPQICVYY